MRKKERERERERERLFLEIFKQQNKLANSSRLIDIIS